MMLPEVKALVEHYKLEPLPIEETLFVSTYRSDQEFGDGKPWCNAIIALYCDEPRSVSRFHKLPVDEVWHFYGGDPLRLVLLYPDGSSKDVIMGNDPLKGHYVWWPEEDIRYLGVRWPPDLQMICLRVVFVMNLLMFIPTELTISTC
jgi:predicted cupin superfamily sugar epimerase